MTNLCNYSNSRFWGIIQIQSFPERDTCPALELFIECEDLSHPTDQFITVVLLMFGVYVIYISKDFLIHIRYSWVEVKR